MAEKYYSDERNVQIIVALLKANGIRKIIASPGTTNYTFVGSVQSDPFFEVYSSYEERSAAYMACGMAAESGEPVVLSCTGATASRDYYPGLTEAFYRKLPVLAITSHQGRDRIGQLKAQNVDRRQIPHDIAKLSVELPVVRDARDEAFVEMEANKAVLELTRDGGGPVHINLYTTYSRDFSIKEIPPVRVMHRYHAWDSLPEMPSGRIAVYVGSHRDFSEEQRATLDSFCATYDAVVICDHTSGYYGRYRLLPTLVQLQGKANSPIEEFDLMIHIGEVSAATFASSIKTKEIWRVSEDGELRDPFHKLKNVFQMSEAFFFRHYGKDGMDRHDSIDRYREICGAIYERIPELPFGNLWAASQLSGLLPEGALLHISVSNTRRCWNMFPLPKGVTSSCNVGCCGIDGCTSTLIGASLVDRQRICYFVTGDLAFFYDLNAITNRHIGNNVRILLVNNGGGGEFQLSIHPCYAFGKDSHPYMAAVGHNGNKSPDLVKHMAEDLGFQYLTASTKEQFMENLSVFTNPQLTDKSMIFEIFTNPEDESEALKIMSSIDVESNKNVRDEIVKSVKNILGESGVKMVKQILKK